MKQGKQTYRMQTPVYIAHTFAIGGPYEAKGSFRQFFDYVMDDDEWGCKTHEKTEIKMQKHAINGILEKSGLKQTEIDCLMGGDLLNQIVPSSFSAREFEIPFTGMYNACATFAESLAMGSTWLQNGMRNVICTVSSHYATAERQYRYPLELGTQPTPASQWTVTAAASALLTTDACDAPVIESVTLGKVVDLKCTDANNMGAAMAPAACDTILTHLRDTGRVVDDYDLIVTGDLGRFGMDTLRFLAKQEGIMLEDRLNDCGAMVYKKEQKPGQGGSGAGCSASVYCAYLHRQLCDGAWKRILFVPTGALLSKASSLQGESIPGIAHAVEIVKEN